jgi:hypothetical protein
MRTLDERTWWTRPGLEIRGGRLTIAGRDAETLARQVGTPLYAHDLVRVEEQARALEEAFADAGLRGLVRLAVKAQREGRQLAAGTRLLDCLPQELRRGAFGEFDAFKRRVHGRSAAD